MKQKLLLALFVLFASVGAMRAANGTTTLKVAASSGDVKVTFTGTGATISGTGATTSGSTFTIPNHNDGSVRTYTITTPTTTTGLSFTGNMDELTVNADELKAVTFGSNSTLSELVLTSANALTSLTCSGLGLETLTLTSATSLATLNCSNNQLDELTLTGVTTASVDCSNNLITTITPNSSIKYTKFDCSTNKLIEKITLQNASVAPTYGYQTIEIGGSNTAIANKLFDIAARATGTSATLSGKITSSDATWGGEWKKLSSNGTPSSTSEAHKDATYPTQFTFHNGTKYQSGDYIFSVVPTNATTHPIKYWVKVTVNPAELNIILQQPDKVDGNKGGTITVSEVGGTNTKSTDITSADDVTLDKAGQGKQYNFTATAVEGFKFKNFDISGNTDGFLLKSSDASASMETYELVGLTKYPEKLKVKPVFEAKTYTINYKGDQQNGKYIVRVKDGKAFENGKGTAAYGQTVVISAQPDAGYKTMVTIGTDPKKEITEPAEIVVKADVNIAISFERKTTSLNISADRTIGIFQEVSIDGNSITAITPGNGYQADVTPNTTVVLKLTMNENSSKAIGIADILFNGQSLSITKGKTTVTPSGGGASFEANTYTVSFTVPAEGSDAAYGVVIKTIDLVATTITPHAAGNLYFTYDGTGKSLIYTTTPANLDKVKLEYSVTTVADQAAAIAYNGTWTEKAPVSAGNYAAKASREIDNVYQEATFNTDSKPVLLTINKAKVTIKSMPTVSIKNTNGLLTYSISGGEAVLGTTKVTGKFEVVHDGTADVADKQIAVKSTGHVVTVAFTAQTSAGVDDANYNNYRTATEKSGAATAQIAVKGTDGKGPKDNVVKVNVPEGSGITVTLKNGQYPFNNTPSANATATVATDTKLTFVISNPNGWNITGIKEIADGDPDILMGSGSAISASAVGNQEYTMTNGVQSAMNIMIHAAAVADNRKEYTVTIKDYVVAYADGKALSFDATGLAGITVKENSGATKTVVSYKNSNGETVALPVEADTYIVQVKIATSTVSTVVYKDKYVNVKMIVTPRELQAGSDITTASTDLVFPTKASQIALGQKLQQATFTDGATRVAGTFAWETPTVEAKNGTAYQVIFKPADTKNYTILGKGPKIAILVSNKQLVTYGNPANGKLAVKDSKGGIYLSGDEVTTGTVLTIQGVANEGFELKSLVINDNAIQVSGDSYTYTVLKDKSVAIEAEFQVKSLVDPNTQYTVTLPAKNAVRGVVVNKPGINAVKKDAAFSFTLSHLAIDRPIVKANEVVLTPSETGVYSIAKVAANTTVTVALAAPTKIKVGVEKITKNSKGFKLGSVQVQGLAADSSCYYGDVITLVAFPESGVTFHSWSDVANADNPRSVTVTTAMTIKPQFTGTPTGIADIEGTKVYGAEGYIYVSCEGQATVTVVTMDGRSQQVRIVGEARIETGAGIYGVILQQGAEVLKMKVVVR